METGLTMKLYCNVKSDLSMVSIAIRCRFENKYQFGGSGFTHTVLMRTTRVKKIEKNQGRIFMRG